MKIKKLPAFSLAELLVVLAIIGIMVALAIPIFTPLITKAKTTEAQIQLKHIYNMQTQHQYLKSSYSMEFKKIKFESPKTIKTGGTANYQYEIIEASTNSFKARAEAVVDFDGDGQFNVWEIDENGIPNEIIED